MGEALKTKLALGTHIYSCKGVPSPGLYQEAGTTLPLESLPSRDNHVNLHNTFPLFTVLFLVTSQSRLPHRQHLLLFSVEDGI